ncbi:TetR family transcriptional regulator [Catenibacterium sp.]|uniref:TetR family transcriptional regulator n=1 Tax=Catenibacterium sp. TaxID=2049022 RepID=UPI003FD6E113
MSEITKHALEDSLKVLLLRKPFNKITMGGLIKECGINRMTFYYHFTDMPHLLSWIILEEIHQLLLDTNIYPEGFIRLLLR